MNTKAVYGIAIALFLPLFSYFIIKQFTSGKVFIPRHYIYDSISNNVLNGKVVTDTFWHRLPDFKLTNQLGRQVGWEDMKGKTVVADFFFTRCPTICPRLTENMKFLQNTIKSSDKVGNREPAFIQFLSFSIDPERDSVPALKSWADRFQINPENWWLLTGSKKEIYDLSLNEMKLGIKDGGAIDSNFMHTDYMVLIDKNRNIRGYYHGLDKMEMQKLAKDVIFLSLEKDPKRKSIFSGQLELIAMVFLITIIGLGLFLFLLKKFKAS